jgi:hypothetical protein
MTAIREASGRHHGRHGNHSRPVSQVAVRLTKRHLARLAKIAAAHHEDLYERRPAYRGRLVAVVLAQRGGQTFWTVATG